jgi:hypothetical protein
LAAAAPARVVVVAGDDPASKEAAQGVREAAPGALLRALADGPGDLGFGDVVVALGEAAAHADYPAANGLVLALSSDPGTALAPHCIRVSPLPDAFCLMAKAHDLVPNLGTLATFTVGDHDQPYLRYLGAAGKVTQTKLLERRVNDSADVVAGLRALPGKAQALWLAPEPLLLGAETFKLVADFCRSHQVALIAPVALLARAGALAGVAPSAQDLGKAAGQAALALAGGKPGGHTVNSEQCRTMINSSVAAAMGLKVSASEGELTP